MTQLLKNKSDIETWLQKNEVENYHLIPDKKYGYVVDVNGQVDLFDKALNSIAVKFNHIQGSFVCAGNNLTSLEGCPENR